MSMTQRAGPRIGSWLFCAGAVILAAAAPGAIAQATTASGVTPDAVGRMIEKYGARQTVRKLMRVRRSSDGFGDYELVLSGVGSGDRRWLALVPKLRPGTDAATGEALVVAVAEALPKNPVGVLRLVRAHPEWRNVCTYPMMEPTAAEERSYFRKAIPAVKSVRARDLRAVKASCLAALTRAQRS